MSAHAGALSARGGSVAGVAGELVLLGLLGTTIGVGGWAWAVGLISAAALGVLVTAGMRHAGRARLGPADLITLTRAVLGCAVAALAADAFWGTAVATPLVTLATLALVLDAVDGRVARRTGTASGFGARFDGEADAFLILALSVYVARDYGGWVLAIGAARYAFALGGLVRPWLRARLPPRPWRKVVAAVQGIVLTVAAAEVVPREATEVGLLVALALLAESFGRDVLWCHRHCHRHREQA